MKRSNSVTEENYFISIARSPVFGLITTGYKNKGKTNTTCIWKPQLLTFCPNTYDHMSMVIYPGYFILSSFIFCWTQWFPVDVLVQFHSWIGTPWIFYPFVIYFLLDSVVSSWRPRTISLMDRHSCNIYKNNYNQKNKVSTS